MIEHIDKNKKTKLPCKWRIALTFSNSLVIDTIPFIILQKNQKKHWQGYLLHDIFIKQSRWGVSSAGRAPALHAGGHRFDPDTLHHDRSEEIPNGIFFCALFKWYKKISRFHILQQEKIREYGFFISSYIYDFAYRHQTEVHIPSQSRTGYSPCADGYGKYLTS